MQNGVGLDVYEGKKYIKKKRGRKIEERNEGNKRRENEGSRWKANRREKRGEEKRKKEGRRVKKKRDLFLCVFFSGWIFGARFFL